MAKETGRETWARMEAANLKCMENNKGVISGQVKADFEKTTLPLS